MSAICVMLSEPLQGLYPAAIQKQLLYILLMLNYNAEYIFSPDMEIFLYDGGYNVPHPV
jgi:hypothetical protein